MVEIPELEDLSIIPTEFNDFQDFLSKSLAFQLPPHWDCDCAIDFLEGVSLPKSRLYPLSITEEAAMEDYCSRRLKARYHLSIYIPNYSRLLFCEEGWRITSVY